MMNEVILRASPCRDCEWCEYDTRYHASGQAYRDYSCFYPRNWRHFGRRDSDMMCRDYSPRESSMEAA